MKGKSAITDKRTIVYAAVLGAGSLVATNGANAAVVQSLGSSTVGAGSAVSIANGVTLTNSRSSSDKDTYTSAVTLSSTSGFVTSNVGQGTVVGPHLAATNNGSETLYSVVRDGSKVAATTGSTGTGLYGFSFVSGGITNYGWASVTVTDQGKPLLSNYQNIVASLNSFAYTTAGEHILAGTTTTTAAVPEAESVAMLAAGLGLMGVVAKRRRLNAKSKSAAMVATAA